MVAATITPTMSFPSPYYHLAQQQSQQSLSLSLSYPGEYTQPMYYDKLPSINLSQTIKSSNQSNQPNQLSSNNQSHTPQSQHHTQGHQSHNQSHQPQHQHQLLQYPQHHMPVDYYYYSQHMSPQSKPYTSLASPYTPYTMGYGNYLAESYAAPAESKRQIDYSQLVSYTNSTVSRRRRRSTPPSAPSEVMYPCGQCGKVFQKSYNLKSHMRTHSREKPYACSVCGKTFARSHDMRRHQLLHEGKKNFKCEGYLKDGVTKWGCGRSFARSDALTRHFRTETGWLCIKPFMDEARSLGLYTDASQAISDATAHNLPMSTPGSEPSTTSSAVDGEDNVETEYSQATIYPSQTQILTPEQTYSESTMTRKLVDSK
ncbi:Transcriptional regulator CRZ2 [Meyerozyma sp. JA9]|nr:Transcriptional regulator CRZ2 [Meyerozyma sp. JA9]